MNFESDARNETKITTLNAEKKQNCGSDSIVTRSHVPTGLVGLHQGFVDVVVGGVAVPVGLLPLVQLLFNGTQGIVDLCGRGVRQIRRSLSVVDLLTHICSSQRKKDQDVNQYFKYIYNVSKERVRVCTCGEVEVVLNHLQVLHHIRLFGFGVVQSPLNIFQLWLQVCAAQNETTDTTSTSFLLDSMTYESCK